MKTRWDQPHLTPLRHDYQLLRDCYRPKQKASSFIGIIVSMIFAAFLIGYSGLTLFEAFQLHHKRVQTKVERIILQP